MKRILTLTFVIALVQLMNAQSLLIDNFTYSDALTNNSWVATSGTGTNDLTANGTGLTFTGFRGSGIGNSVPLANSGQDVRKAFDGAATVSTGSVFSTFMIKVTSSTTTVGSYVFGLNSGTTNFDLRVYIKSDGASGFEFGVGRRTSAAVYTANNYTFGTTYLVTVKYTFDASATLNDIVSLYVHPLTGAASSEPMTYTISNNGAGTGNDATAIESVFLRQGTAGDNIVCTIDGIHVATDFSTTIPVELLDFKAQKDNQKVKLLWSTASELNNAYYSIERSENGKSFDKIGEISGYGNSNVLKTYQFMDEKPLNTVNYYRLRQVDFDGKETVYKTVSVNFGKNTTTKVYPTIAKDKINVEINGDNGVSDLLVVNLLGQVLKAQKLQNTEGVFPVNISDLPNGSYIMRIVSKNESISQRFEKQ